MSKDAKTTYAQSSDIKSRTYLQYRYDMKKKAIAELEVLEWLRRKLPADYPGRKVTISKSGGDHFLWFLRKGGISRDPDYVATIDDERIEIEFQYGRKQNLPFSDFKVSKVTKKNKSTGKREALQGRMFLIIDWTGPRYTIVEPQWIFDNGEYGMVPAWRSYAFRVPSEKLDEKLIGDESLKPICDLVDAKIALLEFQHGWIESNQTKLSSELQKVVDEDALVSFVPKDLESFFKVCFILDHIDKSPLNAHLWLVYLMTWIGENQSLKSLSRLVYCMDFLYSKVELKPNEISTLKDAIPRLLSEIKSYRRDDGSYQSSPLDSPLEETRCALFCINLLEDLTQDMIFYYEGVNLQPIGRIFENVVDVDEAVAFIRGNSRK